MSPARLPTPHDTSALDFWIDEAIWGHRIYNEQTPWMTLLEMLNVLWARTPATPGLYEDPGFGGMAYQPARRMALRNILFNNPYLEDTLRRTRDDEGRWQAWLEKMKTQHATGLGEGADFSYLRQVFPSRGAQSNSFEDFAQVVNLLRATSIEGDSNKRWTSKFAFPYGPACLFPDLSLDAKGVLATDRRFFARTGEVVYLMLCRSGHADEVFGELQRCVLDAGAPWNRLVERLQPPTPVAEGGQPTRTGYLPYAALPDFTALAQDMLVLLRTRLPGYDVLPHLVDVIGLHLMMYLLRRAAEWSPDDGEVRLVLEIIAPKRTTVRDLAVDSYQVNNQRSAKAVEAYITREIEQSDAWRDASALIDDNARREAMRVVLWDVARWKDARPDDAEGGFSETNPERALKDLKERAKKRHEAHLGDVHLRYAQAIGLASRRGTRRIRYAPSDQLLKTLVLAVVPKERMEFQQFLEALWQRYRMVIGHHQAKDLLTEGKSDQVAFADNARRLEMRLASLGLLRRLSDACAYVENPMGGES